MTSISQVRPLLDLTAGWPSWTLTARQLCDVEMLLCGAFAPLWGFMDRAAHESVCRSMRLPNGHLMPIPVTLDLPEAIAASAQSAGRLVLRDPERTALAVLSVTDVWRVDRLAEAAAVYGTTDPAHPGVKYLLHDTQSWCVAGTLAGRGLPRHESFLDLRLPPADVRVGIAAHGWSAAVSFLTRNPLDHARLEVTQRALAQTGGGLLLHPVVGVGEPGDIDHYTRVRGHRAALRRYPPGAATLAPLPLAMRMAGPREALWHAMICRTYGATHFVVGPNHASPSVDRPFYEPYAAQELVCAYQEEIGTKVLPFGQLQYVPDLGRYLSEDEIPAGSHAVSLSYTEQRQLLKEGTELPAWVAPPEVAAELRRRYPPRHKRGFTVFLTGLPSSGKSTLATSLRAHLLEHHDRTITLLDSDIVCTYLSSELGFSKEHRDLNIRRIGYVAAEVTKHGGIAICAATAPYEAAREEARSLVEPYGGFILVHMATPIEVCESRDHKGQYAKARVDDLPGFTGISDPYEWPTQPDVVIDGTDTTPAESLAILLRHLARQGYLRDPQMDEELRGGYAEDLPCS